MAERCAVVGVGQTHHDAKRIDVSQVGLVREANPSGGGLDERTMARRESMDEDSPRKPCGWIRLNLIARWGPWVRFRLPLALAGGACTPRIWSSGSPA